MLLPFTLVNVPIAAAAPTLIPVDGEHTDEALVGVTASSIRVVRDEQLRDLPLQDVVVWGCYRENTKDTHVLLTDGSVIVADVLAITEEHLRVVSEVFDELLIPLSAVAGVVFEPPTQSLARDRLIASVRKRGSSHDRLLLVSGDRLTGQLLPTEGTSDFGIDSLLFQLAGQANPISIPAERVVATTLRRPHDGGASPGPLLQLGLTDGSLMSVNAIEATDSELQLELVDGLPLSLPSSELRQTVAYIRPRPTQFVYLSDLPNPNYRPLPYLEWTWPLGIDRNVRGEMLRVSGATCHKGLGMHSASRVAFKLDQPYRTFQAELALDDIAGNRGSVVYRVYVQRESEDGPKWHDAYASPIVRGGDSPMPISVDVSNSARIALIVEFADRGHEMDHADWLNARLVR